MVDVVTATTGFVGFPLVVTGVGMLVEAVPPTAALLEGPLPDGSNAQAPTAAADPRAITVTTTVRRSRARRECLPLTTGSDPRWRAP
jgi:hypothetical protein